MHLTRAVLFDLDDTLFDHTYSTRHALAAVQADEPALGAWTARELERRHTEMLDLLHPEVLAGRLSIDQAREERFRRLLGAAAAKADRERAVTLAQLYRRSYQSGWRAVAGAVELLRSLKAAGVGVAVVTNNLTAEQQAKLVGCGLAQDVDRLITSEDVGVTKPDALMFTTALDALGVAAGEAVVLGDAWNVDIVGARAAGLRAVWLNRRGLPSPDPVVPELNALEPLERTRQVLLSSQ